MKILSLLIILLFLSYFIFTKSFVSFIGIDHKYFSLSNKILDYTNDYINTVEELNERELKHLDDVKKIIETFRLVLVILIGILILYQPISFLFLFFFIFIFLLLFLCIFFMPFDKQFYYFHKLLFKDGTWQFNKKSELLSNIYPITFWKDIFNLLLFFMLIIIFIYIVF